MTEMATVVMEKCRDKLEETATCVLRGCRLIWHELCAVMSIDLPLHKCVLF